MHAIAYKLVEQELKKITLARANVLDVGSLDINGTYRPLITQRDWQYTGIDIRGGKNVDIITRPYNYPFPDNHFDIVISGSTMEHVPAIWKWIPELVRVLKPAGFLLIATVYVWGIHRFPVDCWRILPDGIKYLFDQTRLLENYDIRLPNPNDILATAFKRRSP